MWTAGGMVLCLASIVLINQFFKLKTHRLEVKIKVLQGELRSISAGH